MNKEYSTGFFTKALIILQDIINQNITLSKKEAPYLVYLYTRIFGACSRKQISYLIMLAKCNMSGQKNYSLASMPSQAEVSTFINHRIKEGTLIKNTASSEDLYILSKKGMTSLCSFISSKKFFLFEQSEESSFLEWIMSDDSSSSHAKMHSASMGVFYLQFLIHSSCDIFSFDTDTWLNKDGNILDKTYSNEKNIVIKADSSLFIKNPGFYFFVENDMGTEFKNSISDKMYKYTLLKNTSFPERTAVHFTLGTFDYNVPYEFYSNTKLYEMRTFLLGFLLSSMGNVLKSDLSFASNNIDYEQHIITPDSSVDDIVLYLKDFIQSNSNLPGIVELKDIYRYLIAVKPSIKPDECTSVIDFFKPSVSASLTTNRTISFTPVYKNQEFIKRRDQIISYLSELDFIPSMVSLGTRITFSSNKSDGLELKLTYPFILKDMILIQSYICVAILEHLSTLYNFGYLKNSDGIFDSIYSSFNYKEDSLNLFNSFYYKGNIEELSRPFTSTLNDDYKYIINSLKYNVSSNLYLDSPTMEKPQQVIKLSNTITFRSLSDERFLFVFSFISCDYSARLQLDYYLEVLRKGYYSSDDIHCINVIYYYPDTNSLSYLAKLTGLIDELSETHSNIRDLFYFIKIL